MNLGIPDCIIAFRHGQFVPVETKVVQRGQQVKLRAHQVAFHMRHAANGNRTYIIVQYHPPGSAKLPVELLLYRGGQAMELFERGLDLEPHARWPLAVVPWGILGMMLDGGR